MKMPFKKEETNNKDRKASSPLKLSGSHKLTVKCHSLMYVQNFKQLVIMGGKVVM